MGQRKRSCHQSLEKVNQLYSLYKRENPASAGFLYLKLINFKSSERNGSGH